MRRLVLLFASMALTVLFGSGVTLADSPTTKEDCKNSGYAKYGFKNQGQCIKAVNHATPADTTAPPAEIVAGPADGSRSNTGFLRFGSTEANVRFECAMREVGTGDPVFAPCDPWPQQSWASSGEFVWAVNAPEATYKFWLRAYDQAGNFTELTRTFTYDRTGPGFTQTSGPSGTINTNTATFEFASSAGDFLRFQCALDLLAPDGSIEDRIESDDNCQSPKTYTNLADGNYRHSVEALDTAGNKSFFNSNFTVDTAPVFYLPESLGPFENRSATVEWTTSEPVHSVKCELYLNQSNGEVVQINIDTACSSPKTYQGINPGTYTFVVSGRDSSNQPSEPYEVQFEVI